MKFLVALYVTAGVVAQVERKGQSQRQIIFASPEYDAWSEKEGSKLQKTLTFKVGEKTVKFTTPDTNAIWGVHNQSTEFNKVYGFLAANVGSQLTVEVEVETSMKAKKGNGGRASLDLALLQF